MQSKCFANCHMTPKEFGVWNYLRSVSHESGVAYLSGQQIAHCFSDTGKDAIYDIISSLLSKGWIEMFSASYRNAYGILLPRGGTVLDHDQWVANYGDGACRPVVKSLRVTGGPTLSSNPDMPGSLDSPVEKSRLTCREFPNNIEEDFDVDSEKAAAVEEKAPLPPLESKTTPRAAGKKNLIDKDQLFHEMRSMWRKANLVSAYNTTPRQDGQLLKLAKTYGLVEFLGGYALWLRSDASDQIEMKHAESLSFPVRKFIEQASNYVQEFRDNEGGCRTHKNYAHVFSIARTLGDFESGVDPLICATK